MAKDCYTMKSQKHDASGGFEGFGCTEQQAINDLLAKIIKQAEKERDEKGHGCKECRCSGSDNLGCRTEVDLGQIRKHMGITFFRSPKCEGGVGYRAYYQTPLDDKDERHFLSGCHCVPVEWY